MQITQKPRRPPRARLLRAIYAFLLVLGLIGAAASNGYLLAWWLVGERWQWVAFANNFFPWWVMIGGVGAALALLSPYRRWLVPLYLPLLLAGTLLYGPRLMPRGHTAPASQGLSLTVATYNIHASESDPSAVARVLAALDVDIVGLQEMGPIHEQVIQQRLIADYPYQVLLPLRDAHHNLALISRYPILSTDLHRFLDYEAKVFEVHLNVAGTPVTIFVLHAARPQGFYLPTRYDDTQRDGQLAVLRNQFVRYAKGPVLVFCDCNMTDRSDAYRAMTRSLRDAFRDGGAGLGFTYPADLRVAGVTLPPMLRIDYIWHSAPFTVLDARVWPDSGTSDHFPVVAQLDLRTGESP